MLTSATKRELACGAVSCHYQSGKPPQSTLMLLAVLEDAP